MKPLPSKATTRRGALRQEEIITMAAQCFMERGFHATSIDDVARRLGCTKGLIYYHYATKSDLFFDVHREGMRRLFSALEPALKAEGTGLQVLEAMLMAHACAMFEHHTFESVVAQGVQLHRFEATTPDQRDTLSELIESRAAFEGHFKRAVAVAIDDGTANGLDISITAKALLGAVQWSIYWYRPGAEDNDKSRSELAHRLVKPLIDGLRIR